jgi:membrane-bound serine protease (ClpP class)
MLRTTVTLAPMLGRRARGIAASFDSRGDRLLLFLLLTLALVGLALVPNGAGHSPLSARSAFAQEGGTGRAMYFTVPLPITGTVDLQVRGRIERALKNLPKGGDRPTFILEFQPAEGADGSGSDFGRSLSLANFLSGEALAGVRTVAWLPKTVRGHAVLPVLACEQIVMAKEAELGAATDRNETIDPTVREGYREIASRRRVIPEAVALGLLDPEATVFKVTTLSGVQYVGPEKLEELRTAGEVVKEETLFQPGDPHLLSGVQMRQAGFVTHVANNRRELAAALSISPRDVEASQAPDDGWKAIRVDIDGLVHRQQVNWTLRTINDRLKHGDVNLLVIYLRSPGGDPAQSLRLARRLAELGENVHSVALVERQALADASLIALACDSLIVQAEAKVGGPGEANLSAAQREALRDPIEQVMHAEGRDWSLPLALIDPSVEVYPYTRIGSDTVRYLSAAEYDSLEDRDDWQRGERPLKTADGLTGLKLEELGLARAVQNIDEFRTIYQIEGELRPIRANWALVFIEWLSDPRIAGLLLFVAWFALMFEMSSPGVGLPGFISATCFLLYFWSQFLHGTAGWLEVLLFAAGMVFVAVELFLIPGTGAFGIGGGLMIIASIILASQTFVLPANAYQMKQLPVSLLVMATGLAGGVAAIFVIRRFLPNTPYLNRMLLKPPEGEELEELNRRESLVSWEHLAGKTGFTTTPLVPAGKAQFGDELIDVISDGEMLERGTSVYVAEVLGNRVIVRRAPGQ